MRPSLICKSAMKACVMLLCVYLAVRAGDFVLSSIFSTMIPARNGDYAVVPASCPEIKRHGQTDKNGVVSSTEKRDKILKGPSQFANEDSNLPYLVESYRTSALVTKTVKLLTTPVDVPCRNLARFGMTEPGGHDGHLVCLDIMPEEQDKSVENKKCLVYSFGVGYDFSFEDQIIKRGCEVHSFDPSMIFMDHVRGEGVNFHRLGLHDADTDDYAPFLGGYIKEPQIWRVRTLDTILSTFGHEKRNVTILKVDVEGSEWALIEYLLFEKPQLLAKIDQFIVEWHIGARQQRQIDAIYKLAALFRKCSGFSLVYADHWRRDSNMQAFLTTYVNAKLMGHSSFFYNSENK